MSVECTSSFRGVKIPLFHIFEQLLYICKLFRARIYYIGQAQETFCPVHLLFSNSTLAFLSHALVWQVSVSNLFKGRQVHDNLWVLATILTTCQDQSSHKYPDSHTSLLQGFFSWLLHATYIFTVFGACGLVISCFSFISSFIIFLCVYWVAGCVYYIMVNLLVLTPKRLSSESHLILQDLNDLLYHWFTRHYAWYLVFPTCC